MAYPEPNKNLTRWKEKEGSLGLQKDKFIKSTHQLDSFTRLRALLNETVAELLKFISLRLKQFSISLNMQYNTLARFAV